MLTCLPLDTAGDEPRSLLEHVQKFCATHVLSKPSQASWSRFSFQTHSGRSVLTETIQATDPDYQTAGSRLSTIISKECSRRFNSLAAKVSMEKFEVGTMWATKYCA